MSFKKNWTATGEKEMVRKDDEFPLLEPSFPFLPANIVPNHEDRLANIRCKPGIGSNDQLDEINEQFAEHERAQHEAGECLEDCQQCAADAEAEHYQQSTFDRLQEIFKDTPIINPWTKVKP